MRRAGRRFFIALSILTTFPVPQYTEPDLKLAASVPYFPLAGALIGGILAGVDRLVAWMAPSGPPWTAVGAAPAPGASAILGAITVLGASALLTGGIHLDGWADTLDGLASRRGREDALNIMRDPRLGAAGCTGLTLLLLFKLACLLQLQPGLRPATVLLMPVVGRQAIVLAMPWYGYARAREGLAGPFAGRVTKSQAATGLLLSLALLSLVVLLAGAGSRTGSWIPIGPAFMGGLAMAALFAHWVARRLGGMTGDTYGATCEVAEAAFLFLAGVWWR